MNLISSFVSKKDTDNIGNDIELTEVIKDTENSALNDHIHGLLASDQLLTEQIASQPNTSFKSVNKIYKDTSVGINIEQEHVKPTSEVTVEVEENNDNTLLDSLDNFICCKPVTVLINFILFILSLAMILVFVCIYVWYVSYKANPNSVTLKNLGIDVILVVGLLCSVTFIGFRYRYFKDIMVIMTIIACLIISVGIVYNTLLYHTCKVLLDFLYKVRENNAYEYYSWNIIKRIIVGITNWFLNMGWANECREITKES